MTPVGPGPLIPAISASNTQFSNTTVRVTGGPGVVVGTDASGVSISASAQSVQTQGTWPGGIQSISASDAEFTSGRAVLTGAGAVTVSAISAGGGTNRTVTVSAPVQSAQTQSNIQGFAGSNTTYATGTVELTGSNAATIKSSANQRLVVDVPVQSAQTQSNIQAIAASDTTYQTGQVQFTGSNAVTVKSSANQRVVIDAPTQSVQTQSMVRAISASDATYSGTVRITGGPNVTVGTDANGVSISGAAAGSVGVTQFPHLFSPSFLVPFQDGKALVNPIPNAANATGLSLQMIGSGAQSTADSNSSGGWGMDIGVYTRNADTLSLATSASSSFSWTSGTNAAGDWGGITGGRRLLFTNTFNLTPGDYWILHHARTTNVSRGWLSFAAPAGANPNQLAGVFGAVASTGAALPGYGVYSSTYTTTGVPASIAMTAVLRTNAASFAYGFLNTTVA